VGGSIDKLIMRSASPHPSAVQVEEASPANLAWVLTRFARVCGLDTDDGLGDPAMTARRIEARLEALSRDNPAYFYALYQFHRALDELGLQHACGRTALNLQH
jgi:hypothetical protein